MTYYFYRFAAAVCPRVPVRFGYALFAFIGDLAFFFSNRESAYFENLRRVLGAEATLEQVNAIARRGFQNLLKNYFDLFRAHRLKREKLRAELAHLNGFEHIENALKKGKGAILGSGHFGAWDMIINLARAYLDTRVVLPVERLAPEKFFQLIIDLRSENGVEIVPLENAPRAMIQALRAGEIVGVAYDRDITHTGVMVDFFGAPAKLPDGPVQLALKFDAPLIFGVAVRREDNRCDVYIEPP
ncbi:MAG: hypothetical protein HY257_10830, partial [Chloroflexi bacterium]|nr:hypothetical protein [Chloroflexota bacterium]